MELPGPRYVLTGLAVSAIFKIRANVIFIFHKLNGRYGLHGVHVAKVAPRERSIDHDNVLWRRNAKEITKI